ncbi:MAG TPA: molecular chaperone TorD family protein [Bacteroidales bacterium]|nr:molecular chaperone TorD family protein [Bacteroidales bacterium]HRT89901.1 molecular chaperone TorD family protein [Bacteroidales bacterium]
MTVTNKEEQNVLKGYMMMLYFSGTMIMFDPSQECIYDFWTKGILKALPVKSDNPEFIRAASLLRESSCNTLNKHSLMQEDYRRLFSNAGKELAPPYESWYRKIKDKEGRKKLADELNSVYDAHKWVSNFRGRVPEDHLGVELLFLTHVTEKYIESEGSPKRTIGSGLIGFIDSHLLSWLPAWKEDVDRNSITIGYKGIASLLTASAEDIKSMIVSNLSKEA